MIVRVNVRRSPPNVANNQSSHRTDRISTAAESVVNTTAIHAGKPRFDTGLVRSAADSGWKSTSRAATMGHVAATASAQPTSGTRHGTGRAQWRGDQRGSMTPTSPADKKTWYAVALLTHKREMKSGAT